MRIRLLGHYWHLPLALLWIVDSIAAIAAYWLAARWLFRVELDSDDVIASLIFGACVALWLTAFGLFSHRQRIRLSGLLIRISLSVSAGTMNALPLLIFRYANASALRPVEALSVAAPVCWALLLVIGTLGARLQEEPIFKRRVLVLGVGARANEILTQLRRRTDQRGIHIVGFVALNGEPRLVAGDRVLSLGGSLLDFTLKHRIAEIIVAMDDRHEFPPRELFACRLAGIQITDLPTFFERQTFKLYVDTMDPTWLIFGKGFCSGPLRNASNRLFDIVTCLVLLVLTSPIMVLAVLAIKAKEGIRAPVLFRQVRVGRGGQTIKLLKLRSMRIDAEGDGNARWAQPGDSRTTQVGALLRRFRIDELPQLYNILLGDMSFVGPRPERPVFVERLSESIPYYGERHAVKPGLTGWAQLCYPYGASEYDAREKLRFDLFYIKYRGIAFDLLILLQTVEVVLLGRGVR